MAETSGLWTTSGAPAGHQVASYTQALASDMLAIASACSGFEGVAPGYLSELAPTSTGANNVRIAAGGAMVDGKYYKNSANIDTNIISAVGGGNTRIDRIVIRCTWASFHAEVHLLSGTDAAVPSAPAITQTSGTTYDILICQVLVTTAGAITITDERTWAAVNANGIKADAVTTAKILDANVTAAKIANRTRTFLVIPVVNPVETIVYDGYGLQLPDADFVFAWGAFSVPSDFVSTMTVAAIIVPGGSGNIYVEASASYGTIGEAGAHTETSAASAVAVVNAQRIAVKSLSLTNAAVGDYIFMYFSRDATNIADTVAATVYITGFLVSYTADS